MLPHYSPFKVAETFSLLAGLFPGRIDLGIGRAAGTDPMTTFALQRDRRQAGPDDFPEQLAELLAHYEGGFPENHPFARLGQLAARRAAPARRLAARLLARRARSGPASSACPTRSPTSSTRTARPTPSSTASASSRARLSDPAHRGRRLGDLRRDRRGGRAARLERAHVVHAAAPGPPDPGAAAREGAALPRDAGRPSARRGVIGSPETVRAGHRGDRLRATAPRRSSSSRSPTTTARAGGRTS